MTRIRVLPTTDPQGLKGMEAASTTFQLFACLVDEFPVARIQAEGCYFRGGQIAERWHWCSPADHARPGNPRIIHAIDESCQSGVHFVD
jgi:hypothetical protein